MLLRNVANGSAVRARASNQQQCEAREKQSYTNSLSLAENIKVRSFYAERPYRRACGVVLSKK